MPLKKIRKNLSSTEETPEQEEDQENQENDESSNAETPEKSEETQETASEDDPGKAKTYSLKDYLPETNIDGEEIGQRRPKLESKQKLKAMCFLSELNMNAIYFFCNEKMLVPKYRY